jgi:hypothetical protein
MDMSRFRDPGPDDPTLIRYLLGLLPDEEAERLDEETMVDDEAAERLRAAEHDLIDAYVRGALDPVLREQFEAHYLASPLRREKVVFAQRFAGAIDRAAPAEPVPAAHAGPDRREHHDVAAPRAFAVLLSVAALLLLVCGVFAIRNVRLARNLADAHEARAALERQSADLTARLDAERDSRASLAADLERSQRASSAVSATPVLLPQTRGAGPLPIVAVARDARTMSIDLRLDASDFSQYQVALEDPATNHIVWRSGALAPGAGSGALTLTVAVPVHVVRAQHYAFELLARRGREPFEVVGSYAFEIELR